MRKKEKIKESDPFITAKVIGGKLNVRSQPSLEASILYLLEDNETVRVIEWTEGGEWAKLTAGYCMAKYLEITGDD